MAVTKKDVEHVAKLARLGLTDEEKGTFTEQLSAILEYAGEINKLDTKNAEPTSHAIPMKNVMREDRVSEFGDTGSIVRISPQHRSNMFSVPRIME